MSTPDGSGPSGALGRDDGGKDGNWRGMAPVGQGSLTEQTTRTLLDAILHDRFIDNRLPPEPELATLLNVSRTTIRAALQSLERLGIISRTPGRGTIVLPHVGRQSIALQRMIGFRELLKERHDHVEVKQNHHIEPGATPEAVETLGVAGDTPMLQTAKLYTVADQPAIYLTAEIPMSHFDARARAELANGAPPDYGSIFELSRSWAGPVIHHTLVELISSIVPDDLGFPLDLAPGSAYLTLRETHYTVAGDPVALGTIMVDDRFQRFQIVRHL